MIYYVIIYYILSIFENEYGRVTPEFNFTDKNLEKDIELFLKPFKIFINYINNEENTENKKV